MKAFAAALTMMIAGFGSAFAADGAPSAAGDLSDATCAYPEVALKAKASGATLLSYFGNANGSLGDVAVLHSSGNADLDAAAVACVKGWHFDPASKMAKFNLGQQRVNIGWALPKDPAGKAVGRRVGIAHSCREYYPEDAIKAGIGGLTQVRFFITTEGKVRDPAITVSSGNASLDEASLTCVKHWRYRPALKNKEPVEVPWKALIRWSAPDYAEPIAE